MEEYITCAVKLKKEKKKQQLVDNILKPNSCVWMLVFARVRSALEGDEGTHSDALM